MIKQAMTATEVLDSVLTHESHVVEVKWYRNSPASKKLLMTVSVPGHGLTKVLAPEGSHQLYDAFKGVAG